MADRFDVVILGSGSAGENVATALAKAGRTVALVEDGRVGGECAYVACIPSKAMLRAAEARHDATELTRVGAVTDDPALGSPTAAFAAAAERRDDLSHHRDDSDSAQAVVDDGVTLLRGHGRVARPGAVTVGGRELAYTDLVIATGSAPSRPDLPGLADVPVWTSDDALAVTTRPDALIVLGGGAVGCELAQSFARFGTRVVLMEPGDQLLGPEQPEIAARLAEVLRADAVEVHLGCTPSHVRNCAHGGIEVELEDGSLHRTDHVLLATGRGPRTTDLGLECLGLAPGEAVAVDDQCRVTATCSAPGGGVWAAGDVTGAAPYTHTASYQARIVVGNLTGRDARADLRAVPRVVYTDPPVASVGIDAAQARDAGVVPVETSVDLAELPRAKTDGCRGGRLVLTADRDRQVLIGASIIGPTADSLIGEAVLAIRAEVPLRLLADVIHAFPTYAAAYELGFQQLLEQCAG